jgi:hypothetical protein
MTLRDLEKAVKSDLSLSDSQEWARLRLRAARDACNATGLSREAREFVSRELLEAKAVAQEWGVYK